MKQHIFPAIALTIISFVLLSVAYPMLIWGIAQAAPGNGKGETLMVNNLVVGYEKEGQLFNQDNYFWSRPSAVAYNAAVSGGSNKGPTNPDYLSEVRSRIDSFLVHNPGIDKNQIPSDIVTASGSGLDPNISPAAAFIQIKRIAGRRSLTEDQVKDLIDENIEQPLLGLFGTARVNVLKLNIALDNLKK